MVFGEDSYVKKIERFTILFIMLSLPFVCIPLSWRFPVLGSVLFYYPIFVITILFLVFQKKDCQNFFLKKYILIGAIWGLLTLVNGILIYPYYGDLNIQEGRLFRIIQYCSFIDINSNLGKMFFMIIRSAKIFLLDFICGPMIMYIVYNCFNCLDSREQYKTYRKFVLILILVLMFFAIPEVLYYKFHWQFAREIMVIISGSIQDTSLKSLGWWPPLIWYPQLRSICTEPGLFGSLFGISVPFLLSYSLEYCNIITLFLYCYYNAIAIMAQSRTAFCLLVIHCFTVLSGVFVFSKANKNFWKILLYLFLGVFLGFFNFDAISNDAISNLENVESYYYNTVESVVDSKSRSNPSRLINLKRTINVGLDHCLLGVGTGLKDNYIAEKITVEDCEIQEIKAFYQRVKEEGVLKSGFGNINQYADWFVAQGLIGLIYYLLPVFYLFYIVLRNHMFREERYLILCSSIIASLASMMVGGCNPFFFMTIGLCLSIAVRDKYAS